MTEERDPDRLADKLHREADEMDARSGELGERIEDVRHEWEQKRADESVPGAPPRTEDTDRDAPGDEVNPEDAGREEHESPETPARAKPEREE